MKWFWLISLVVIAGLVAGCGSTSGPRLEEGEIVDDPNNLQIVRLAQDIRQMQSGDEWEYCVTGSVSDGSGISEVSGDYSMTVSANNVFTPQGEMAIVVLQSGTLTYNGNIYAVANRSYVTQDSQGLWVHGGAMNGNQYWVDSPSDGCYLNIPSPMIQGCTWEESVRYTNATAFELDCSTVGTVVVEVPAGAFEAWKITGSGVFAGMPATVREWWAPQIGAPAQRSITFTDDSQGLTFSLLLKLANVSR